MQHPSHASSISLQNKVRTKKDAQTSISLFSLIADSCFIKLLMIVKGSFVLHNFFIYSFLIKSHLFKLSPLLQSRSFHVFFPPLIAKHVSKRRTFFPITRGWSLSILAWLVHLLSLFSSPTLNSWTVLGVFQPVMDCLQDCYW